MNDSLIRSDSLEVSLVWPPQSPRNQRFDAAAMVGQITLEGKRRFCVPEQLLTERRTTYGVGLSGEFQWHSLADEAKPGELFPKLGVGLLKQRPEGGSYNMWQPYDLEPFDLSAEVGRDRALYVQEPRACLGVAARVYKELVARGNTLSLYTTLENTGERTLELLEYQHNFLSIDGLPVGPGYELELPGVMDMAEFAGATHANENGKPLSGVTEARGQTLVWKKPLANSVLFRRIEGESLAPMARYRWRLSHRESAAAVTETASFRPHHIAVWAIEHCVSTEMFVPLTVKPGECASWSREWVFEG